MFPFQKINQLTASVAFIAVIALAISCSRSIANDSHVKIDAGIIIDESPTSKGDRVNAVFKSVTFVGESTSGKGCTSTAVSTNTAITAAHCVYNQGDSLRTTGEILGKNFCVTNSIYDKVCSTKIFASPKVTESEDFQSGSDVAFVIYPDNTFKSYFQMTPPALSANDEVVLVGYSEAKLKDLSKGSKRFGYSRIEKFLTDEQNDIFSIPVKDFESVGVSPGDSGGPLLKGCVVAGVASRMVSMPIDGTKRNIHTNLTYDKTIEFLKSVQGAYFCGLTGVDETHCPKSARYIMRGDAKAGDTEFPCILDAGAILSTTQSK